MALPCPDDDQPDDTQAPASHKQQQQQEEEMVMHQRDSIYYYNTATRSIRWTLPDVELFGAKTPPGGGGEPCAEAVLSLPAYQALLDLQQEEEERIMPPSTALTAGVHVSRVVPLCTTVWCTSLLPAHTMDIRCAHTVWSTVSCALLSSVIACLPCVTMHMCALLMLPRLQLAGGTCTRPSRSTADTQLWQRSWTGGPAEHCLVN